MSDELLISLGNVSAPNLSLCLKDQNIGASVNTYLNWVKATPASEVENSVAPTLDVIGLFDLVNF